MAVSPEPRPPAREEETGAAADPGEETVSGTLRIWRYLVEKELKRDELGYFLRGADAESLAPVVLRLVRPGLVRSGPALVAARRRIEARARTAAQLRHPHLATVLDFHAMAETDLVAVELVEGRTLENLLRAGATWTVADAARCLADLADGLAEAHSAGLVHGNVVAANVRIAPDDRPVLLDLGVPKPRDFLEDEPGTASVDVRGLARLGLALLGVPPDALESANGTDPSEASPGARLSKRLGMLEPVLARALLDDEFGDDIRSFGQAIRDVAQAASGEGGAAGREPLLRRMPSLWRGRKPGTERAESPGVEVEDRPVIAPRPAAERPRAPMRPAAAESSRPVEVERPPRVERPARVGRPAEVERPAAVERLGPVRPAGVERPEEVRRAAAVRPAQIERPPVVERPAKVERPVEPAPVSGATTEPQRERAAARRRRPAEPEAERPKRSRPLRAPPAPVRPAAGLAAAHGPPQSRPVIPHLALPPDLAERAVGVRPTAGPAVAAARFSIGWANLSTALRRRSAVGTVVVGALIVALLVAAWVFDRRSESSREVSAAVIAPAVAPVAPPPADGSTGGGDGPPPDPAGAAEAAPSVPVLEAFVRVHPPGSTIRVAGGGPTARDALELAVPYGDSVLVTFSRTGYVTERHYFKGSRLAVALRPDSVLVRFEANVTADVFVEDDGIRRQLGTTDLMTRLPSGTHRILFRAQGQPDWLESHDLTDAGRTYQVAKTDYITVGDFVATVPGSWARVSVDGGPPRESPARFDGLSVGLHAITVSRGGFATIVDTVLIEAGKVTRRQYTIRR